MDPTSDAFLALYAAQNNRLQERGVVSCPNKVSKRIVCSDGCLSSTHSNAATSPVAVRVQRDLSVWSAVCTVNERVAVALCTGPTASQPLVNEQTFSQASVQVPIVVIPVS